MSNPFNLIPVLPSYHLSYHSSTMQWVLPVRQSTASTEILEWSSSFFCCCKINVLLANGKTVFPKYLLTRMLHKRGVNFRWAGALSLAGGRRVLSLSREGVLLLDLSRRWRRNSSKVYVVKFFFFRCITWRRSRGFPLHLGWAEVNSHQWQICIATSSEQIWFFLAARDFIR